MRHSTRHLLGSTTLVLILAAPCLALAETGDVVRSNSDTTTNYGRAGGQAYFSTAQPPRTPQVVVSAYETTKGYVEHAYEQTKGFVIDSAQGRASQELVAQNRAWQRGEVDKPITSGASIGAYGREGVRTYWSNAQRTEPPRVVTDAYEKTKEFLTATPRQPTSEQTTLFNGA